MSNIRMENDLVVGTSGDKYVSKNPIAKYLVSQFDKSVTDLATYALPDEILEIGCGEGHVTSLLLNSTQATIHATEISSAVLEGTKSALTSDRVSWEIAKLETYHPTTIPDMVVCCEVLEHIPDPFLGLKALAEMQAQWYLLSVPREPIWRILNMMRGVYLKDFGNSPGHIQHWSKAGFVRLIADYFEIVEVRSPLPWTVVLCRAKR